MHLFELIIANSAQIIHEWEQFATKLDRALPRWFLKDHAPAIVKLLADQTKLPLVSESQVLKTASADGPLAVEEVTSTHVQVRVGSGFDLAQIIGEYLALRSCVLRMWRQSDPHGLRMAPQKSPDLAK